jgi:hypothetical protein
MIEF